MHNNLDQWFKYAHSHQTFKDILEKCFYMLKELIQNKHFENLIYIDKLFLILIFFISI